jgi:hypothetical protein
MRRPAVNAPDEADHRPIVPAPDLGVESLGPTPLPVLEFALWFLVEPHHCAQMRDRLTVVELPHLPFVQPLPLHCSLRAQSPPLGTLGVHFLVVESQ